MSHAPSNCPCCGTKLPADAPEGLCPRCLGALSFATETVPPGEESVVPKAPPLTPEQLAAHFPQLEIIECLGRGGMGVVYKARQKSLNRIVALKLLAPERVQDAKFAERFAHEAQALARLSHPSIVTIHDFGEAGGFYFLLMEFVDGVNLRQLLRSRKLTPEEALAIVPPLCDALQYAHERGIVHRDIKPENLLLDKEGRIKIADFGIAKMLGGFLTDSEKPRMGKEVEDQARGRPEIVGEPVPSVPAGTPGYMAPEQSAAPQTVDARADIYSLGVVFYEMLTGELPGAKLQPPSRKVQIDVRLDEIVLRALEQTPELRYATAAEFRTRIETLANPKRETRNPEPAPRILKTGNGVFATPEKLSTFAGQMFHWRARGQMILDDSQFTLARGGEHTVIPLAAIRDVSLGQYPRAMNPTGLDLISLTYEQDGQLRQLYLSPMDGLFGLPSNWNERVADWHAALRQAVQSATGRPPATTPRAQLPRLSSAPGLVLMLTAPIVAAAVFNFILILHHRPGESWDAMRFLPLMILLCGFAMLWFAPMLFQKGRRLRAVGVLAAFAALFGFLIVRAVRSVPTASEAIKRVQLIPVGVTAENVVEVDIATEVERWSAEVRAGLSGPHLDPEVETKLRDEVVPAYTRTLIKPVPTTGNQSWKVHSPGRQMWRVGFALPTQDLAREAFRNLRPVLPFVGPSGEGFESRLFTVRGTNGAEYRAMVQVMPVVHAGNPEWVTMNGQSSDSGDTWMGTWTVQAAQPGSLRVRRGTNIGHASLGRFKSDGPMPGGPNDGSFPSAEVRLELKRINVRMTEVTRSVLGQGSRATTRETVNTAYATLVGEVKRSVQFSAKTVRGEAIELCRVNGESLVAEVLATNAVLTAPAQALTATPALSVTTDSGHAMFAPVVGEGISAKEFRAAVTLAKPRHVALMTLSMESPEGKSEHPGLSYYAAALDGNVPFATLASWTADTRADGLVSFQLKVSGQGGNWINYGSTVEWLRDYEWTATRPDRSHWVGPGEWNFNDTNSLVIFEGAKRGRPEHRATVRLNFSLFRMPDGFRPTMTGHVVKQGANWRTDLGLAANHPFPVTSLILASPAQAGMPEHVSTTVHPDGSTSTTYRGAVVVSGLPVVGLLTLALLALLFVTAVVLILKGGRARVAGLALLLVPLLMLLVAAVLWFGYRKVSRDFGPGVGVESVKAARIELTALSPRGLPTPPGDISMLVQSGYRVSVPPGLVATFEAFERQWDDSWQPLPALNAFIATGEKATFAQPLWWTLRRVNEGPSTNQLWTWRVSAVGGDGTELPQRPDHEMNRLFHVPTQEMIASDVLNWSRLSVPAMAWLSPGQERRIPVFRTEGLPTARGRYPKEIEIRIRCERASELKLAPPERRVELGLRAHTMGSSLLPAFTGERTNASRDLSF